MSIRDVTQTMHRYIDELEAAVSGKSSDADCQAALERFIQSTYHGLGSLCWYLGADAKVFEQEAVAASELAAESYFEINREREFEAPAPRRQYSPISHRQLGLRVSGADLR